MASCLVLSTLNRILAGLLCCILEQDSLLSRCLSPTVFIKMGTGESNVEERGGGTPLMV